MENKVFEFKTLSTEDMIEYISKNAPKERAWFLTKAYETKETKEGTKKVYNHLKAKRAFCEKFMPELLPVKKARVKATKTLEDWLNDADIQKEIAEIEKAKQ